MPLAYPDKPCIWAYSQLLHSQGIVHLPHGGIRPQPAAVGLQGWVIDHNVVWNSVKGRRNVPYGGCVISRVDL